MSLRRRVMGQESGGASDANGFVDFEFNVEGSYSGAIEDNVLINYNCVGSYKAATFALKRPIYVEPNDVIRFKIDKISGAGAFSDVYAYGAPNGVYSFKANTNFNEICTNGVSFTNTLGYPIIILALKFGARLDVWANVNGTCHLWKNDELIF